MATIHMTCSEVVSDFGAVLEKIRDGVELVVEENQRPVAMIRSSRGSARSTSAGVALAEPRGPREGVRPENRIEEKAERAQAWSPSRK